MAGSPPFKVYIGKEHVASVKEAQDGAAILAWHHESGNTIRLGHGRTLWTEGIDGWASHSYDEVAFKVEERLGARVEERLGAREEKEERQVVTMFTCDTCGKKFKPTKIGGEWYAVRREHFGFGGGQS